MRYIFIYFGIIYTDFSKAFDKVDHLVLLKKMQSIGVCDSLLLLFRSYLCNRQQYVCYKKFNSDNYFVYSGVPQGSNLGPLLFIIFINDICTQVTSQALLFADDLKLFRSIDTIVDVNSLQSDINTIAEWCDRNKLHFNTEKCKVMQITRKKII